MNLVKSLFAAIALLATPILAGSWGTYTVGGVMIQETNVGTVCHLYTTSSDPYDLFVFVVDDFGSKVKCDMIRDFINAGATTVNVYSDASQTLYRTYTTGTTQTDRIPLGVSFP